MVLQILRVVKHEDKLELDSVTDSPRIYQEYFIKEFSDNIDYGIYIDEDEIGHYFTTYGEVQIFSNLSSCFTTLGLKAFKSCALLSLSNIIK